MRFRPRWRTGLLIVASALIAGLGGAANATASPRVPQAPRAAAPAAASFTDDFDGAAGAGVDQSKWRFETGDNVNNHEREYYTSGTNNAALDGQGHLVITARKENPANYQCWYGTCQYTSARLNTSATFTQAYGHFESRMKLPRGQGMWPAFWMLGTGGAGWPGNGEVDIMENVGFEPGSVHGTIHGPGYSGSGGIGAGYTLPGGQAFADGFHTFAVDWSPNSITWSVDGNAYETRTPGDLNGNHWVFDHPFYLLMNLAVGGYWPGDPDGSTTFPQQLVVDYVHVTTGSTGGGGGGGGGQITGYGGKCVDVASASSANGTPVQLYDCNGSTAQNWTVGSDQTLRALGKCLDLASAGTANGTQVQLYDCNGTAAQKWQASGGSLVNPASGRCLDATGPSSANGTRLQIWDCAGSANQQWTLPS